jgi:hypothetical protein
VVGAYLRTAGLWNDPADQVAGEGLVFNNLVASSHNRRSTAVPQRTMNELGLVPQRVDEAGQLDVPTCLRRRQRLAMKKLPMTSYLFHTTR